EREMLGDQVPGVEVDDHDRLRGAGPRRLLDRVLDCGAVDDREERLGHDPGGRPHPGAAPGGGNDGDFDAHVGTFCSDPLINLAMLSRGRKTIRATIRHTQRNARSRTPISHAAGGVANTVTSDARAATLVSFTRISHAMRAPRPSHGTVQKRTPSPVATPRPPLNRWKIG